MGMRPRNFVVRFAPLTSGPERPSDGDVFARRRMSINFCQVGPVGWTASAADAWRGSLSLSRGRDFTLMLRKMPTSQNKRDLPGRQCARARGVCVCVCARARVLG